MECQECRYMSERVTTLERRLEEARRALRENEQAHPRNVLPNKVAVGVEDVIEAIADGYITDEDTLRDRIHEYCDSAIIYYADQYAIISYGDTTEVEDWGSPTIEAKIAEAAYQILEAELCEELSRLGIVDECGAPILPPTGMYVHTNGGDYIFLADGSMLGVTPEVFADLLNADHAELRDWHGTESWRVPCTEDTMSQVAEAAGVLVATMLTDGLLVHDDELWTERGTFFGRQV